MASPAITPHDAGGASILIAEDNADSLGALKALLEAVGYQVHAARDGQEAVQLAEAVHPDLVLMDIMMPVMNGFEATRELRRSPSFDGVPILALTAMEGARERALEAGCDDYVTKPIEVSRFFEKIRDWLQRSRAG